MKELNEKGIITQFAINNLHFPLFRDIRILNPNGIDSQRSIMEIFNLNLRSTLHKSCVNRRTFYRTRRAREVHREKEKERRERENESKDCDK